MKVQLPHLDLMCLTACQLRCVGCTNGMGFLPMEVWPAEQVIADAEAAAAVMHAGTVCLLGGEPTSHPHLVEIMRDVREIGLGDKVQVLTNGMRLHRMSEEFWAEVQELKISIYPGKTPPENVELARSYQAEYDFGLEFYDVAADTFRAVHAPPGRSAEVIQATYDSCWYRTYTRKIEQGYFYRCCTSPSISKAVLGLPADADGIALDGLTPATLREFLSRPEPANACSRCHGNLGPRLPEWSESRSGAEAWLAESTVA